ncbi:hypothetical protein EDC94DRAFT_689639 [Helicostylum pulchrum]|nr:hypothetical protein EDC94DRAFT_689639 [Helicostylum pulchrum]
MDSPRTPRTPRRQETLGPTSPIQDWEVERATVLSEYKSSREKAERLEKKLESDRGTYERNTQSLLREVKLKETYMDKKLKDSEEQLMETIVDLQRQLVDERTHRQDEIQTIRNQHESALESEDRKYQRRLTSLQERLNAKDAEYAVLLENNDPEKEEQKVKLIEYLNRELAKEKEENAKLRESNLNLANTENESVSKEFQHLQSFCASIQEKLQESEISLIQSRQQQNELSDELIAAKEQSRQHKRRLAQIVAGHDDNIKQLQEKFSHEAHLNQMTTQAQFQNMQSEHTEMLREIREQHEIEKEVWHIEQQSLIDQIRRDAAFEKEEATRELTREWADKHDDLSASMSKDSMEIQTHWEAKLEEAKEIFELKASRLQGEMEVVKDRLGKEIVRRKQNQQGLTETLHILDGLQSKCETFQKKSIQLNKQQVITDKEFSVLKSQYRTSYRLARDLLSITSHSSNIDSYTNVPDILQTVVHQVSTMRIHADQQDTFDIATIPTYGF